MLKIHIAGAPPSVCGLQGPKEPQQGHGTAGEPSWRLQLQILSLLRAGWWLFNWGAAQLHFHPSLAKDTPGIFRGNVLRREGSNSWILNQAGFALGLCVIEGRAEQPPHKTRRGIWEKSIHSTQTAFLFTVPEPCKTSKIERKA